MSTIGLGVEERESTIAQYNSQNGNGKGERNVNRISDSNHILRILTAGLACVLVMGFAGSLWAQEGTPPMPEGAKKLQVFAGDFEGTGTMTMEGKTHNTKVSHINETGAGGWAVTIVETVESSDMETYRGENIFGYEAGSDLTHLYSVSNYGDCHDHKGKWSNEKTLVLQYEGFMNGVPMVEVINIVVDSPTQYSYTVQGIVGGQPAYNGQATMRKK
jgi:hypothetical protein